ncbi:MAG: hypothetical protein CL677_02235 [Bdellovibrionaceae bacterium]|nr:hypothetical protein [Pseudobdellovibrionaceae bacterium]
MFEKQPEWGNHHNPNPDLIFELLPKLGLDMDQLRTDMESEKISEMIDQDTKDLKTLEVRGTPTFFVNGRQLYDFSPDGLKWLINDEIKKNY